MAERNAYSVSQLNRYLRNMFEQDFVLERLLLKGEVSNLKYHSSGHIYFTLKDAASQISAIMFAGDRAGLAFQLEEGMQVIAAGSVSVYERGGSYQLYAKKITLDGRGDLFVRYEQLKRALEEMGMFDPMYKKPIPRYARRIGIVTSKTGAAVRDIIQIATRRNPYVELVLYPVLVQGDGAVASIVKGIQTLDRLGLDVLIVGRGGGSVEDLWAFNDEAVAQAIFDADTPIISAVGHETDTTIADFVADLRAPTPSAAAELAVFDYMQFLTTLAQYRETFARRMKEKCVAARKRLDLEKLRLGYESPAAVLAAKRQQAMEAEERLVRLMQARMEASRHRLALASSKLEACSPLARISAGYAYVSNADGARIDTIQKVSAGALIRIQLRDGEVFARAEQVKEKAMLREGAQQGRLPE